MTIHRYARKAFKSQLKKDFQDNKYAPQTVDGLLDYLFDEDRFTGYLVYQDRESYDKTTLGQRLNRLWIVPCWWLAAPILWITTGDAGISQHTKLGEWLAKKTGL